ncbi:hypothetical protein MJO29_009997 [Puccinia striiformis f. sp. tritici]|uniref:hypothetical protein n=1 Tax=Puccinia striiformis f. sp. tritici TaxID=168172 RepID=UPI0020089484|nr:hypothetical protein Pst134EA_019047 [Puccinia striiformis f. sp. tritici]KAH9458893.1 hypothetical protein Pst134EA_019047 [Puccinia striiformis f. sp. tritici]KAI7948332.1 hypothetical protein MJO29_009997 [Puccinia striiformis f. sp. tritici]KAI9615513.1 hypothetical protein H4Q26_011454 [Puccinia striiformis f. sp. tritici PST-130]
MGVPDPPPPSRTLVFLTVSFYLVAALVMVFVNKWVLNSVSVPIFLLFCQLSIAVILLKLSHLVGLIKLPSKMFRNLFNSTNSFKLLKDILPMVLINVSGLIFNTYCLKFVDASFYQVARGLILPFTVFASHVFLGTRSSLKINISVMIVCLGFILGVSSERFTVSHLGVILGILSSITTSIHAIIVKKTLEKVPSTIALTYYSNGLSALIVFPLIFILGETQTILQLFSNGFDGFKTFFIGTIVTGLFGFFICIAGLLSIKVTSPVTHMISSAVRGVIQTILGSLLFQDKITSGRVLGIGIILIGSIYYTWIKDQEVHQNNKIQDNTFNSTKNIRLNEMNNDNPEGRAEEMDSLILDIDNDDQDDQEDDDEDQDQRKQTYVDQLSPIITTTPQKNSDHNEADDNNDDDEDDEDEEDEDEDMRELRKAEKALGITKS